MSVTSNNEPSQDKPKKHGVLKTNNTIPVNKKAVIHHKTKHIALTEDYFGSLYHEDGTIDYVKRFTWTNHNKITVQVITYGARITSIKLPNRGSVVEDVVLGFDDLAGYLHYGDLYMGAVIGRTSNRILNGTYVAEGKQYWISQNDNPHHYNGGHKGLDKVVWESFVDKNQVILSCVQADKQEGYPGSLYVRIIYELTTRNEFKITITANSTHITPVDITNMVYFNLAGHDKGKTELEKHLLLLNSNCYSPMEIDKKFPTGEIMNVSNSRFDFQTPKILKNVMGLELENGYDQNFCINKGVDQEDAFIARVTHPYSGRILEIYSNQRGVNFYTADRFSSGLINIASNLDDMDIVSSMLNGKDGIVIFMNKLEEYIAANPTEDIHECGKVIRNLLKRIMDGTTEPEIPVDEVSILGNSTYRSWSFIMKPFEIRLIEAIKLTLPDITENMDFMDIKELIDKHLLKQIDEGREDERKGNRDATLDYVHELIDKQICSQSLEKVWSVPEQHENENENLSEESIRKIDRELERKGIKQLKNEIPPRYTDGRIHGKCDAIYKRQGAFVLQTQNYPNALYHKNFPSPMLRPHQTYTHTITYKFWMQTGNPTKWLQRMEHGC